MRKTSLVVKLPNDQRTEVESNEGSVTNNGKFRIVLDMTNSSVSFYHPFDSSVPIVTQNNLPNAKYRLACSLYLTGTSFTIVSTNVLDNNPLFASVDALANEIDKYCTYIENIKNSNMNNIDTSALLSIHTNLKNCETKLPEELARLQKKITKLLAVAESASAFVNKILNPDVTKFQ
ncbi:hypothetical protein RFI_18901, partial [Reticulomyxa filosa]